MKLLNFFLSALSAGDYAALAAGMSEVTLAPAEVLADVGSPVEWIYFPSSACVSFITVMSDGKAVETSTVGREGVVSLLDIMADRPSRSMVIAQIGGSAMRAPAAEFRSHLARSRDLMALALLQVRAAALQAEQAAACNASHGVGERLARWLLMTQDRVGADRFPLTQEYMAVMTGVQRSTISVMAAALKAGHIIDYTRGAVRVLDRPALVRAACECYCVVGEQFEELREVGARSSMAF